MELIRKIKQAEVEAHQTIEQAKAEVVVLADKGRQVRRQRLDEAELQRRKTIDEAVERARTEAQVEVKALKARAEQDRRQLREHVKGKVPGAVAKVVDYLKGTGSPTGDVSPGGAPPRVEDRVRGPKKG